MQGAIKIPNTLYKLKIIRELNLAAIHFKIVFKPQTTLSVPPMFEMHPGNFVLTACCSVSAEYCPCVKIGPILNFILGKRKKLHGTEFSKQGG